MRQVILGLASMLLFGCVPIDSANTVGSASNVPIAASELSGKRQPWSYAMVQDPVGERGLVERFELRNGDCQASDCTPYDVGGSGAPRTRARIEKHVATRLEQGEEAVYRYSFLIPSQEFTQLPGVTTAIGQLFLMDAPTSFGGGPLFILEVGPDGKTVIIRVNRPALLSASDIDANSAPKFDVGDLDTFTVSRNTVGIIGGSIPMDTWVDVAVNFRFSATADGYLTVNLNGRRVAQYSGPTALPSTFIEYDYGIYQSGTNQYPGGAQIPPQVVYFSNVGLIRTSPN